MVVELQCSELQNFITVALYLPCFRCSSRSPFLLLLLLTSDFCVFMYLNMYVCMYLLCSLKYLARVNFKNIPVSMLYRTMYPGFLICIVDS
jgi:hypothetical protein